MSTREYVKLKISNSWIKYKMTDIEKEYHQMKHNWEIYRANGQDKGWWQNQKCKTCGTT